MFMPVESEHAAVDRLAAEEEEPNASHDRRVGIHPNAIASRSASRARVPYVLSGPSEHMKQTKLGVVEVDVAVEAGQGRATNAPRRNQRANKRDAVCRACAAVVRAHSNVINIEHAHGSMVVRGLIR